MTNELDFELEIWGYFSHSHVIFLFIYSPCFVANAVPSFSKLESGRVFPPPEELLPLLLP